MSPRVNINGEIRRMEAIKDVFFRRLLVSDPLIRKKMVTLVTSELLVMIDSNQVNIIENYYPTIVRLAHHAPFPILRDAFVHVQTRAETKWSFLSDLSLGRVSYFFENQVVPSTQNNANEHVYQLFCQEFLETGCVSHFTQVLAWHPSYLDLFHTSMHSIMIQDGTLPLPWRYYIALMGASELRCHYIADWYQSLFLRQGGEYDWLKGLDYIPSKLFRLHELSCLLAHRPWLLTSQHIGELLRCQEDSKWSVAELVHAIIVLCTHHSMCSIALGLGLIEEEVWNDNEIDLKDLCLDQQVWSGNSVDMASIERDDLHVLKQLQSMERTSDTPTEEDECPEKEFEGVEQDTRYEIGSERRRRRDTLWRFCQGSVIKYSDFNVHATEYDVFHTEDFNWEEHGFSLLKRYFPGQAGQILDDLFHLTDTLTYDTFGRRQAIDTSPYRMAIWYYVHRLFGICHDDYDYRQVNLYLNRPTKIFIKKVACTPWKVVQNDFLYFDHTLSSSEKCHITLLVAEARKQAGLMYGLRAVMKYMR